MSGAAMLSMGLIVGTVVGGFLFFLIVAIRKDRQNPTRD